MTYTPAISGDSEWLFRSELRFDFPVGELLALRFGITNVSDNNPSPDVGNNKTTTKLALALNFP